MPYSFDSFDLAPASQVSRSNIYRAQCRKREHFAVDRWTPQAASTTRLYYALPEDLPLMGSVEFEYAADAPHNANLVPYFRIQATGVRFYLWSPASIQIEYDSPIMESEG